MILSVRLLAVLVLAQDLAQVQVVQVDHLAAVQVQVVDHLAAAQVQVVDHLAAAQVVQACQLHPRQAQAQAVLQPVHHLSRFHSLTQLVL